MNIMNVSGQINENKSVDKIVFEFHDSPMPPKYQKNYTIIVSKSLAEIIISNEKTERFSVKLNGEKFNDIIKTFFNAKLGNRTEVRAQSCVGGTTDEFKVFMDNLVHYDGFIYHCGQNIYGNLTGDYEVIKKKLKSLFPKFSKELK